MTHKHPYDRIDISTWDRKDAFYFFRNYADPFFQLSAVVDVSRLLDKCKKEQTSFFLASLYWSSVVCNELVPFRLRLAGDDVICFHRVDFGSTVLYEDTSFGFCFFDFANTWEEFHTPARLGLENQRSNKGLDGRHEQADMIHYSVIPWVSFTAFKHARKGDITDSIPKIVFGKYYQEGNKWLMPVSVDVHHALMDGYHVGQFFTRFQQILFSFAA